MATVNLSNVNMITIIGDLLQTKGDIDVVFDNGETVVMKTRVLILHLIFWNIAKKWGVHITPDMIVNTASVNSSTISDLGTKVLDRARQLHDQYHDIVFDFNDAMNYLNRFVIDNCQAYHKSLSILDLARITQIPAIKEITEDRIERLDMPIAEADKYIKRNFKRLYNELKRPHPDNRIYDFINLRFVKDVQLAHMFYQIGFRTDINDTTFRYPVSGNYLDGLKNVTEYCLEALSAKKSAFYNKDSLPTTEYFGRRQHILLSSIRHLYPGDCGTHVTLPFFITEKLKDVVMYKNIVDGGRIITLSAENIDQYVGKMVHFRTPLACRHRDGVCEVCGGKLLSSITPNTHVGIFSAIQTTSVVTQVILSAKHMQDTRTVEYVVPPELNTYLFKNKGSIFVKPKIADKFRETSLVFTVNDAVHLLGLSDFNLGRLSSINEMSFGTCKNLIIMKGNTVITDQACLEIKHQSPLYSKHLIQYIAEHPQHVTIRDGMFILSMLDFDFKNPIFKLIVMNDSMVKFVASAQQLLENKIKSYTSATALVNDFTNLIYEHVHPNIAYLEVVLRAAMISGKYDFRVPIVEDIDNVQFMLNREVNMRRSFGMLCAFEQMPVAFRKPSMFLVPKLYSPFDNFLNLKPAVRR